MAKHGLSDYEKNIMADTGCAESEVVLVEEIMRRDVLHSTLDWLTPDEFRRAALEAFAVFKMLHRPGHRLEPPASYTICLERNDLGQILDGLHCREEAWRLTAEFLESGHAPNDCFLAEECRDAEEACAIAKHYQRIISTIQAQMEAQR